MNRKMILPAVAGVLLIFGTGGSLYHQMPEREMPPPVTPAETPYGFTVAGAGIIEPNSEASGTGIISVGSQTAGLVSRVCVHVGQDIKAGELLFVLDQRQAITELRAKQAALELAQAQMHKLDMLPRPEEVPVTEAQVRAAEATFRQQDDQRNRGRTLASHHALSQEDMVVHEQLFQGARAQLDVARANLNLLKAGGWTEDKAIAQATVNQARAQVEQAEVAVRLLELRAPVDGTILEVKVRPGEYVSTASSQPLVLMGDLNPLHVRVNIDEADLPRLGTQAKARARVRGDMSGQEIGLRFVRLEAHMVPKTALTGVNAERVDTRVAQLIYAMEPNKRLVSRNKLLVGQVVDVFLEADEGSR
jgi:multidrug efflux pump subunit AcrA (membrane-fusion protein)